MSRTALKRELRSRFAAKCTEEALPHGSGCMYRAHLGTSPPAPPNHVSDDDFEAAWSTWPFVLNEADPGDTIHVAVYRSELLGVVTFDAPDEMPQSAHGGSRPGAGRPATGNNTVILTASLEPEKSDYVEQLGDGSPTKGVRRLVAFHRQNS